jgi:hypothetical protein
MIFDNILKYKREDEHYPYIDETGCCHQDIEDLITTIYNIPSCGCGNPESLLMMLYTILSEMSNSNDDKWNKTIREYRSKDSIFDNGLVHFVLYWLDQEQYTEHGSSVFGSWLTEKGEEFLKDLEEYNKLEKE